MDNLESMFSKAQDTCRQNMHVQNWNVKPLGVSGSEMGKHKKAFISCLKDMGMIVSASLTGEEESAIKRILWHAWKHGHESRATESKVVSMPEWIDCPDCGCSITVKNIRCTACWEKNRATNKQRAK